MYLFVSVIYYICKFKLYVYWYDIFREEQSLIINIEFCFGFKFIILELKINKNDDVNLLKSVYRNQK